MREQVEVTARVGKHEEDYIVHVNGKEDGFKLAFKIGKIWNEVNNVLEVVWMVEGYMTRTLRREVELIETDLGMTELMMINKSLEVVFNRAAEFFKDDADWFEVKELSEISVCRVESFKETRDFEGY